MRKQCRNIAYLIVERIHFAVDVPPAVLAELGVETDGQPVPTRILNSLTELLLGAKGYTNI